MTSAWQASLFAVLRAFPDFRDLIGSQPVRFAVHALGGFLVWHFNQAKDRTVLSSSRYFWYLMPFLSCVCKSFLTPTIANAQSAPEPND